MGLKDRETYWEVDERIPNTSQRRARLLDQQAEDHPIMQLFRQAAVARGKGMPDAADAMEAQAKAQLDAEMAAMGQAGQNGQAPTGGMGATPTTVDRTVRGAQPGVPQPPEMSILERQL